MPTFLVDGNPYKVSIISPFSARQPNHYDWLSYNAKKDAKADAKEANTKKSLKPTRSSHDPWTAQEDRLLIRLLTFRTPWAGIGVTIQRPVEELKRRWMFLRDGMPPGVEDGIENDRKRTKHVSFADPLVIGGDIDLTKEEKDLLRKLAGRWERDRWYAISRRFNKKTGQNISPEDAKSIVAG